MTPSPHELASHHLPPFITAPGGSDWLLTLMGIILIGSVLGAGVFFFWLHSLPERMVHNKVQFDIVAVLALLSLFTHIHAFWVAALIIALIEFPSFSLPRYLRFARANCRVARNDGGCASSWRGEASASRQRPAIGRREACCHHSGKSSQIKGP